MMAGMGIMSIRNAHGNRRARKNFHPANKTIRPAITRSKESRDRKSSAPSTPTTRTERAKARMRSPDHEGCKRIAASLGRPCQSTNNEKAGTKKPCEKFGSCHHCPTKWARMEEYNQPISSSKVPACHQRLRLAEEFCTRVVNGSICAIWLTRVKDIERIFELIKRRKVDGIRLPEKSGRWNQPSFLRNSGNPSGGTALVPRSGKG